METLSQKCKSCNISKLLEIEKQDNKILQDTISETCRKFAELEKSDKNLANFQDSEFETPI